MALSSIQVPSGVTLVGLSLSSFSKTVTLPVIASNPGRMLIFKDMFGYANNSTIRVSSSQQDIIERSNVSSMILSTNYGAWTFLNDGINKWFLTSAYLNTLVINTLNPPIISRGLIQNLDAATYTSGSTWVALVGNNDTLYNSPTTTTSPGGQTVLVFNGSNQYAMDQTGVSATTTFSFDIWFYASADGNVINEMGQSGAINTGYTVSAMGLVSGNIRVGFWNGSAAYSISLGAYTTNRWTQVSWTYSGGTLTGYVNGVFAASGSQTKSAPSASFYAIAASSVTNFGNSGYFNGRIGAYKLYNVVLTAAEVKQNFNAFASLRYGLPSI